MTYILGARCVDGVVLVGDRKILRGSVPSYNDKLIQVLGSVVMGGAGTRGIFERFSDEIKAKVDDGTITNDKELLEYTEDRTLELHRRYYYRIGGTEILIGMRTGYTAELFNIVTENGVAEPIKECIAIGSGEPYGLFLLKKLWNKEMTMIDFAKLGFLLINYVVKFKLQDSVGGDPQIWFMPDILVEEGKTWEESKQQYPIREATQDEIDKMAEFTNDQINRMEQFLNGLKDVKSISSVSK